MPRRYGRHATREEDVMRNLVFRIAALAFALLIVGGVVVYSRVAARTPAEEPKAPKAPVSAPAAVETPAVIEAPAPVEALAPATPEPEPEAEPEAAGAPEIAPADFAELTGKGLAIVDFKAVWCPACRKLEPVVDSLADEYRGRAFIAKLDVDAAGAREIAARFGIRGIPTLIFLQGGEEVGRVVGFVAESDLKAAIDRLLGKQ